MLPPAMHHAAVWLPTYHLGQLAHGAIGMGQGSMIGHVAYLSVFTGIALAVAVSGFRRDEGRVYA